MTRQCGGCTLCCKLLPMGQGAQLNDRVKMFARGEFNKPAGQRCPHQRSGKGCAIYATRPMCCQMWSCRWLVSDDTADPHRPDRTHYVIDVMPDFITLVDDETGERANVEVVQVWVDPGFRDAYKDPALLAYLTRRGEDGIAAVIRYSEREAFALFPPAMTSEGNFREQHGITIKGERSIREKLAGVAQSKMVKV